jgi:hypothetical protein
MVIYSDKLYLDIRCEIQVFPTTYLTKQNLNGDLIMLWSMRLLILGKYSTVVNLGIFDTV